MNNLKKIRKNKNISQNELGKLLRVDRSIISKVENGKLYERKEFWQKASNVLGVSLFEINPSLKPELPPIYTYIYMGENIHEETAFVEAKRLANENVYTPKLVLVSPEANKYANLVFARIGIETGKSKKEVGDDVMIPIFPPKRPTPDFILTTITNIDLSKYEFIIIFFDIASAVNLMEEFKKISKRIVIGYNNRPGEIKKIKEIALDKQIFVSNLFDRYDELIGAIPDIKIINFSDSYIVEQSGSNDRIKGPSKIFRISSSICEKLKCLADDAGILESDYINNLLTYIDPIDMEEHLKVRTPKILIHQYKEALKKIKTYKHDEYQFMKLSDKSKSYFREAKEMGVNYADLLTLLIELQFDAFCDKENELFFSHNKFSG